MRRSSLFAAAPVAALLLSGIATAQAQEEDAERDPGSRVITPEECEAEPRPAADLSAVLGAGEEFATVTFQVPLGEGADADTALRIEDNVRGIVACLNAGDYLRGAGLTSDNGARVLFGGLAANGPAALEERLGGEPVARTEDAYIRLVAVTDPTVMADGKLAAFVVINEPTRLPRGLETLLFIFTDEGGEVRFDNLVGFSTIPPEALGTPAADATPAA